MYLLRARVASTGNIKKQPSMYLGPLISHDDEKEIMVYAAM